MYKLLASIKKDLLLLTRDKMGLVLMFLMPVILAVLITAVQNSTFDLVNSNQLPVLLKNNDTGQCSRFFVQQLKSAGIFKILESGDIQTKALPDLMKEKDVLIAIDIPENFSRRITGNSEKTGLTILKSLGVTPDTVVGQPDTSSSLSIFFHPVLQESFRASVRGAITGAIQITENKQLLESLFSELNPEAATESLEKKILYKQPTLNEFTVSRNGTRNLPNATQHNIPAWTVFAMFFVVISLGGNIVKEKLNGSYMRLRTLPSSFLFTLVSKQLTYLVVTMLQAFVIFLIGIYLFPLMHLPTLNIPGDILGLILVTFLCGWCAVSYAICIGIFARTEEQSNGVGAVTVVILAAIGGILVPSFAMPESFRQIISISPLHWCLESYYVLFLENGKTANLLSVLCPLIFMIVILQTIALIGLRRKNLI
jgi:ABC-2 type transport system permease protein